MNVVKLTDGGEPPLIESGTIVEYDCSEWVKRISDVPIEQWTRVKIDRVVDGHATLVLVDPAAPPARRHYLELDIKVAEPEGEVDQKIEALIASLSEADRALGGSGLLQHLKWLSPTTGQLLLFPTTQTGAEHRLNVIAMLVQAGTGFAGMPVQTWVRNGIAA